MDYSNFVGLGRRAFLKHGSLVLAAAGLNATAIGHLFANDGPTESVLRIGLVTDLHYADKPPAGSRHYRETLAKLAEAAAKFERSKPALVVELGDLIDAADSVEAERRHLKRINRVFADLSQDRHYVLGNHCVHTLTKDEFLDGVERSASHYSFDCGRFHFVVLDSCFRGDGEPYGRKNFHWTDANIPAAQLEWLKSDLAATDRKTVVLAHQRLDVSNNYGVKNCPEVRRVLENSGKVLVVLQGHSHRNDYHEIGGIHYCTLVAMVEGSGTENNGYSLMDLSPDGTIRITGYRKQSSYAWS
jgi:predicted phosphodiesterase